MKVLFTRESHFRVSVITEDDDLFFSLTDDSPKIREAAVEDGFKFAHLFKVDPESNEFIIFRFSHSEILNY